MAHVSTRLLLIILLCLIKTLPSKAQTPPPPPIQWQRVLAPGTTSNLQLVKASNGGYALSYLGQVLRLSESGNTLWQTALPVVSSPFNGLNFVEFIMATPDGGFGVLARNDLKWSLGRLSANGTVLWVKPFADRPESTYSYIYRTFTTLIFTADGGFLAVDYTRNGHFGTSATILYKFDPDGNLTATQAANNENGTLNPVYTIADRVIQTQDGDYMLFGGSNPITSNGNLIAWIAKCDINLVPVWKKNLSGNGLDDAALNPFVANSYIAVGVEEPYATRTIRISADGDANSDFSQANRIAYTKSLIVGGTNNYTIVDMINENGGDIRLQNIGTQGANWLKKLGGSSAEVIKSAIATDDGGYLILATTTSMDGDVVGNTSNSPVPWLVKLRPPCNGEFYTIQSGNWNDPAIWSCGQIPTATDIVHVKHAVILPQNYTANARQLIYDSAAQIECEQGAQLLVSQ